MRSCDRQNIQHACAAERAVSAKKGALGPRLLLVPMPRQEGWSGTSIPGTGNNLLSSHFGMDSFGAKLMAQVVTDAAKAHRDSVCSTVWSTDGSAIATASEDKTIKVWDPHSGVLRNTRTFSVISNAQEVAWSTTEGSNFVACESKAVQIFDCRGKQTAHKIVTPSPNLHVSWKPDGKYVAVTDSDDRISIIDTRTLRILKENKYDFKVNEVGWNPFSESDVFFMSTYKGRSHGGGTVDTMDFNEKGILKLIRSINGHAGECCCIDFSQVGDKFAIGSFDSIVSIWDLEHLVCTANLMSLNERVKSVSFSHDGKHIAAASTASEPIQVCSVTTGEMVGQIACPTTTRSIAWSRKQHAFAFAFDTNSGPKSSTLRLVTV